MKKKLFLIIASTLYIYTNYPNPLIITATDPFKKQNTSQLISQIHNNLRDIGYYPPLDILEEKLISNSTLHEFLHHGTVFGRKNIESIAPDSWALEHLKQKYAQVVYGLEDTDLSSSDEVKIFSINQQGFPRLKESEDPELSHKIFTWTGNNDAVWLTQKGADGHIWVKQILETHPDETIAWLFDEKRMQIFPDESDEKIIIQQQWNQGPIFLWKHEGTTYVTQKGVLQGSRYYHQCRSSMDTTAEGAFSWTLRVKKVVDLVDTKHISEKILLLCLLEKQDNWPFFYDSDSFYQRNRWKDVREKIITCLNQLFLKFDGKALRYINKKYSISPVAPEQECLVCLDQKYIDEIMHPTCCNSKQTLCLECLEKLPNNRCPFCRAEGFIASVQK